MVEKGAPPGDLGYNHVDVISPGASGNWPGFGQLTVKGADDE